MKEHDKMNGLLIHNVEEKLKKEFKSEDPNDPATMIQKKIMLPYLF